MFTFVTPTTVPTVIPELQNRSVISVLCGWGNYSGVLTSSGKLLMWGSYRDGVLGLGDPGELSVGSPGGYAKEEQRVQAQKYGYPPNVMVPSEVRFDHGLRAKGGVERYCFIADASRYHAVALVFDLAEDKVPPEGLEQHFEAVVPYNQDESCYLM